MQRNSFFVKVLNKMSYIIYCKVTAFNITNKDDFIKKDEIHQQDL